MIPSCYSFPSAEYETVEATLNANFEPLRELHVELLRGFLLDLSAPVAGRNQWLLPLAAVVAAQLTIELFAYFLEYGRLMWVE